MLQKLSQSFVHIRSIDILLFTINTDLSGFYQCQ